MVNMRGYFDSGRVFIDDIELGYEESLKVYNHSPDGFCWGYTGSGPSQLALAIMLLYVDKITALRTYQEFKRDVIAGLPQADFDIDIDIHKWLNTKGIPGIIGSI